jgi:hypothetical protein
MEPEPAGRPDLFDIKFLRDELLYYARDENQFLRRRRTYVFALFPDLARARIKDVELPRQRIILLLALLVAALRRLIDWLSQEALGFEFLFVEEEGETPLGPEQALVAMVLREPVANGSVAIGRLPADRLAAHCASRARRSLCHCLIIAATDRTVEAEATIVERLCINGPRPMVGTGVDPLHGFEDVDPRSGWQAALDWLLPLWV